MGDDDDVDDNVDTVVAIVVIVGAVLVWEILNGTILVEPVPLLPEEEEERTCDGGGNDDDDVGAVPRSVRWESILSSVIV